jgi:hypothetical protein
MFALCTAMLFSVLFWLLARALERRDQEAVEHRADDFAASYEIGGPAGLSALVHNDTAPDVRTLFIRLISPANVAVFVAAPPGWIETQVEQFPVPEMGGVIAERKTQTVRVPQNALRDYTIATHPLPDGWLLQVGTAHRQPSRIARASASGLRRSGRGRAAAFNCRRNCAGLARDTAIAPRVGNDSAYP